jgi:hypothetical protein
MLAIGAQAIMDSYLSLIHLTAGIVLEVRTPLLVQQLVILILVISLYRISFIYADICSHCMQSFSILT